MIKKPGVLKDPWRTTPQSIAAPPVKRARPQPSEGHDTLDKKQRVTVDLKNYGGLFAERSTSSTDVVLQFLNFFVSNLSLVEDVLADYGIAVAQLDHEPKSLNFYIQREDGWTLAVPHQASRDHASMQLIQAALTLINEPKVGRLLAKEGLGAYKV